METLARFTTPMPEETAPYYRSYIDELGPVDDILETLARQVDESAEFIESIGEERALTRYAEGKWSIKEIVGHVIDAERVFVYRALRFARGDRTPLPGFEEDDYVAATNFDAVALDELVAHMMAVRHGSLLFFETLTPEEIARTGTASGAPFSVRAIPFILAGHEKHHMRMIRERYLKSP